MVRLCVFNGAPARRTQSGGAQAASEGGSLGLCGGRRGGGVGFSGGDCSWGCPRARRKTLGLGQPRGHTPRLAACIAVCGLAVE